MKDILLHTHDSLNLSANHYFLLADSSQYANFFGGSFQSQAIPNKTSLILDSVTPDWLSLVFLVAFIYLIIIKFVLNINFLEGAKGLLKIEVLDDVGFEKTHRLFAYLLTPFSIIVYAYYIYYFVNPQFIKLDFDYIFLVFSLIIVAFFILKLMIEFIIAFIFNTFKAYKAYFTDHLYMLGIGSLIQLILLIFYSYSQIGFILRFSIFIMIIFFIYRLIRSFIIGYQLTSFSKSYLFLYLCSLEILPLIWIFKWITDYH